MLQEDDEDDAEEAEDAEASEEEEPNESDDEEDEDEVFTSNKDVKVVNSIVIPVSAVVAILLIGCIVYFFVMRNHTVKLGKHLEDSMRKSQHDTTQSPSKMMSLISFDRMSPEKVMPYPAAQTVNSPDKTINIVKI